MATEIESNGTLSKANLLNSNVPMTGQFMSPSDLDFFKFYNPSAGTTQFSIALPANPNYRWELSVDLYDTNGTLQKSFTTRTSATYSVTVTNAGYSYISVVSGLFIADYSITANFSSTLPANGTYEIENNDSISSANLLSQNITMTGNNIMHSDYFKLYNSGAGTTEFSFVLPEINYTNYNINIYNTNGILQKSYTTKSSSIYKIDSSTSGYSYISVTFAGSYADKPSGDYSITGIFRPSNSTNSSFEIENNGSINTANLLNANIAMRGQNFDASDNDFFKFNNTGAGTTEFSLNLPDNSKGTYFVRIYDTNGNLQKSYTTQVSETYKIFSTNSGSSYISVNSNYTDPSTYAFGSTAEYSLVGSFSPTLPATGTYEVEYNDTLNTANQISLNVAMTGQNYSPYDRDFFKLYVPSAGTAEFSFEIPRGTPQYIVNLYDSNGTLQKSYIPYSSASYSIAAIMPGYVYISIASRLSGSQQQNDYLITGKFTPNQDTSINYSISTSLNTVSEGTTVSVALNAGKQFSGMVLYYKIDGAGITTSDISGMSLFGNAVVESTGTLILRIPIADDSLTEGSETLQVQFYSDTNRTIIAGGQAKIIVTDGSNSISTTSSIKGPATSDLVYVFKSEKTGPAVNPASYSYYYTSNPDEAAYIKAQTNWPWVQKTSTFEAAHSNPSLSTPVFKFWSDKLQAPYFTISTAERDQIVSWSSTGKNGYDWQYAGTGFSVYTSSAPTDALGKSAIPVYCVWMDDTDFNPSNGLSGGLLFTADKVEYDSYVKLVGVTGVGAVFYGEVPGN